MMPWIVPGITRNEMSRFACTGPKAFEMPRSSIAGSVAEGAAAGRPPVASAATPRSIQNAIAGQVLSDM